MNIAIIFAMDSERDAFLALYDDVKTFVVNTLPVHQVTQNHHTITMIKSGIGKVHAAHKTTLYLNHERPDLLINIGVGGGINTQLGDIVVAKSVMYHDVDVRAFNYAYGQIPDAPLEFKADDVTLDLAETVLEALKFPYKSGRIVSGDIFLTNAGQINPALDMSEVYAVDMEAAAIAHVAHLENVAFLTMRSVSDTLDSVSQMDDYDAHAALSATKVAKALKAVIAKVN
jgi:adenosylhomocysteine nucleosidase